MSPPDLKIITGGKSPKPPVDVIDELFEPLLTSLSFEERIDRVCTSADNVRIAAAVASWIVTLNKAELFAKVAEKPDWGHHALMTFARSKEEANQLAAIIDNARMRLAVALDIPIMDEDEVDDDGGAAA